MIAAPPANGSASPGGNEEPPPGTEPDGAGKPMWRSAGGWALRLGATAAVTWAILDQVGLTLDRLAALPEGWLQPDVTAATASVLLLLAGFLLAVHFWARIVRHLGGRRLGFLEQNQIFFTANLGRYVPGKVWQIAGLAYLSRRKGVDPVTATAAAVLGQGFQVAAALLVGAFALGAAPDAALPAGEWILPAVAVGTVVLLSPPVLPRLTRGAFRLAGRARGAVPELGRTFGFRWVGLYAVVWSLYGIAFWLLAAAFGVNGSPLGLGSAFAGAYAAGYLALFAPAGIGVREGVLTALLAPWAGPSAAFALSVVARVWMTGVELLPALPLALRQARDEVRGSVP